MFCLCAQDVEATRKVIDSGGWFDTGDLGWIAPSWKTGSARSCGGVIVLDGRAKDTIVLLNGLLNITNLSNFMFPQVNAITLHFSFMLTIGANGLCLHQNFSRLRNQHHICILFLCD